MMKFLRKLPSNPTLEEQLELLKKLVVISHDDFEKGTAGRIVSLLQHGKYWVLLNHSFKTKNGKLSRRRPFNPNELKLVEDK